MLVLRDPWDQIDMHVRPHKITPVLTISFPAYAYLWLGRVMMILFPCTGFLKQVMEIDDNRKARDDVNYGEPSKTTTKRPY